MALKLITKNHFFDNPGIKISEKVDLGGRIDDGQATVVLRGIEPWYSYGGDHNLARFIARIVNIKTYDTYVEYDVEFDFRDIDDNAGNANIEVLIIAELK